MTTEEYITNPTTGRPVKVGGRVWKQLKRNGLVESDAESTNDTVNAESAQYSRPDEELENCLDRLLEEDDQEVEYF